MLPMHYACYMHNFSYVDFMLDQFKDNKLELFTSKDSVDQSPFSLLFWQIGRVEYTSQIREKIKEYSLIIKKSENFEWIIRAYFPVVESFLPVKRIGKYQL